MFAKTHRALPCIALIVQSTIIQAQILIGSGAYSQNFNTLSPSGTANTWTDGVTLEGWYAGAEGTFGGDYRAGSGTSTTGDLYSFGNNGGGERALGSLASGTTAALAYGVRFKNNTAGTISGISVSYSGEQWRDSSTTPQTLRFGYRISSGTITSADPGVVQGSGGWVDVPSLAFTSLQNAGAGALDGNQAVNRTAFGSTELGGLSLGPGEELFFRWFDANDGGNDHGFGIDDFNLQFTPVPEPEDGALVVGGILVAGFALSRFRRRRREARSVATNP